MTLCSVEGCESTDFQIIDLTKLPGKEKEGFPTLQWIVCTFHHRALSEGEPFTFTDGHETIVMGTKVPPRLLTFRIRSTALADPVITFDVGHDGIKTGEWVFQASEDFAAALMDASLEDGSPLDTELRKNRPRSTGH